MYPCSGVPVGLFVQVCPVPNSNWAEALSSPLQWSAQELVAYFFMVQLASDVACASTSLLAHSFPIFSKAWCFSQNLLLLGKTISRLIETSLWIYGKMEHDTVSRLELWSSLFSALAMYCNMGQKVVAELLSFPFSPAWDVMQCGSCRAEIMQFSCQRLLSSGGRFVQVGTGREI